jgi:hypothetical protein
MSLGGLVRVENPASETLVVTFTGGTWYSNAALSSSVSFPDTITASKTYYIGKDTDVVISVTRNGKEVANTPDGTRTVRIKDGQALVFTPSSDPGDRIGVAEMDTRYVSKAAAQRAVISHGTASVNLPSIAAGETGSATFTLTGAATGDVIVINPPALTTGLAFAGAAVTGTNTVTVYATNATASAIDEAAATFRYLWVDTTA